MTATDWMLLAVVAVSALAGLLRGLVGVVASLAAWVLGGWAAFRFGGVAAQWLAVDGNPSSGQLLAGYGLSFLVVMVAVGLLGWLLRRLVRSVGLSGVDRALGFGVGLARGVLVACVIVLLMGFTALPREPGWRESRLLPVFVPGARWLAGWLPEWAAARVDLGDGAPHPMELPAPVPAQTNTRRLGAAEN